MPKVLHSKIKIISGLDLSDLRMGLANRTLAAMETEAAHADFDGQSDVSKTTRRFVARDL